jgi:hypothetical protein
MKVKRCTPVRHELEELALNEDFSAATTEHLQTCADCRVFHEQQMRLRQIVGSLGPVTAPADFDFRLRARLAADSEAPSFRFWSFTVKGLATAAVLVVFGVGAVVVWQRSSQQPPAVAVAPTQTVEPTRREEPNREARSAAHGSVTFAVNEDNSTPRRKPQHSLASNKPKRTITSIDLSSVRAPLVSNTLPSVATNPMFPIEASLQSVKVSLDDGRGNERTISFPTVSFGSQRVVTNANQFVSKGAW